MTSARGSSSHPRVSLPGDWASCSVSCLRLRDLEVQGYLPDSDLAPSCPGLTSTNCEAFTERFPMRNTSERVCFIPYLLWGLGFPIHPFLRGVLECYGIQLHHLTPGSVLHIVGFVVLCEMFLGCDTHFELWNKFFCLVPSTEGGTIYEVGGAEVWRIAGIGYPLDYPKAAPKEWTSEWFYIEDMPLFDPVPRVCLNSQSLLLRSGSSGVHEVNIKKISRRWAVGCQGKVVDTLPAYYDWRNGRGHKAVCSTPPTMKPSTLEIQRCEWCHLIQAGRSDGSDVIGYRIGRSL